MQWRTARKWFPMGGHPYRLFDSSVAVLVIALLWYVLSTPSAITQGAVGETILSGASVRIWGIAIALTAAFALATVWLASTKKILGPLDYGYGLMMLATAGWAAILTTGAIGGLIFFDTPWDDAAKTLGSALWFAYATSNMAAALMKEPTPGCELPEASE